MYKASGCNFFRSGKSMVIKYRNVLSISLLQFVLSFFYDNLIFISQSEARNIQYDSWWYILSKVIFFMFLIGVWSIILSKDFIKKAKYGLIYLVFMLIFLGITYPGVWRWDDIIILGVVTNGGLYFWQHWISSIYYLICLYIIPIPAGVVFVQLFIISLIIGSIMYRISNRCSSKWILLMYIPLLIPSAIDTNLYPLRASICAYIELYILFECLFLYFEKDRKISKMKIWLLLLLAALLIAWRPENIVYLLFMPLFLTMTKKINLKSLLIPLVFCVLFIMVAGNIQNAGLNKNVEQKNNGVYISEREKYSLTGFVAPFGELVKIAKEHNEFQYELYKIDNIISVDMICDKGGLYSFWNGGLKSLDEKQLLELKKIYVKFAIHYFPDFLGERINNTLHANGFGKYETHLKASAHIYDESGLPDDLVKNYEMFRTRYILNKPANIELRKLVISSLEGKNADDYQSSSLLYNILIYNVMWIVVLAVLVWIYFIIKREKYMILFWLGIAMKFALLVVTVPAPLYMYFFSTQLTCSMIICYLFIFKMVKEYGKVIREKSETSE